MWAKINELWLKTGIAEAFVRHFVRNYMQNMVTKGGIRTFNYRTTPLILEISILLVRAICEIQSARYEFKIRECNRFLIYHFVRIYTRNSKLYLICWCSTYRMTALLSKISIIYIVWGGCKILMVRYTSKCASQSLSDWPFLPILCT